jgi:adenylate cyclase
MPSPVTTRVNSSIRWRYWVSSLPVLEETAIGVGSVNADPDFDGTIRQVSLFLQLPDPDNPTPFYPSLAAEALRVAQGQTTYSVKSSGASGVVSFGEKTGISLVKVGQAIVPTTPSGAVLLYDSGSERERYFSLADLMEPGFDPAIVAGRIIFIGSSVEGLKDYKPTPIEESMTGVEIHTQIAEQIFGGTYLHRPDWAPGLEFMALLVFGIILIVLAQRRAAILGLVIAIVAILGSFGTSNYLFRTEGFLLDPLYPAGAAFLIFVTSTLIGFIRTEREKAHVRGAFSRYLSPILVDQLSKNPEKLKLGGELRELTVMFSDIRGFTKLSEGLDPQRLTTVINSFLTPMTRVIQSRQGTIDKYIGDCIMAFWNAPIDVEPHGRMAILAALRHARRTCPHQPALCRGSRPDRRQIDRDPDRHGPQFRHLLRRQYGLRPALRLFGAGRHGQHRLAPGKPVAGLFRRPRHRRGDGTGRPRFCPPRTRPGTREGQECAGAHLYRPRRRKCRQGQQLPSPQRRP